MGGTLLVSGSDKGRDFLAQLLKENTGLPVQPVTVVTSGDEARRLLGMGMEEYDLILINGPVISELGHHLAVYAAESTTSAVVLMVKAEMADDVEAQVEEYGVLVLAKPFAKPLFFQTIRLALTARRRMLGLKNENVHLQQKIEEIRLVDRAKCVLIQYLGLTEPQAHRYIEKQAMDQRVTRPEVARQVLQTYDT